jgi:amidase
VDDVVMTDWTGRTATEIAAAVRAGEATAGQVVACHLDRIAKLNGELGAFIRVRAAEAASEAEAVGIRADLAELPLAGVPVVAAMSSKALRYASSTPVSRAAPSSSSASSATIRATSSRRASLKIIT